MIKFLINRPIAVIMTFLAFSILGIITYINIPISLLPNIPIPEISVQIASNNTSAVELENTVVSPIRQQLLQISRLRDIQSETRDGIGVLRLTFDYGVNTDLAFIEVNEKIDGAMNRLPRNMERPRVIKASATDIPVFLLNLTFKNEAESHQQKTEQFQDLSELAQTIIKRRIEQLPQVAMVDITGFVNKQILIVPNSDLLAIAGIEPSEIMTILKENNIEPSAMKIRDGHYEYNVNFSSVLRSLEDIQHIYIKRSGRIFQLKDLAEISLVDKQHDGISLFNGKRTVTMGIIKQADENMSDLQRELEMTINDLQTLYPEIEFAKSQNQTALLDYTISNLQQNLILAFVFVCIVSAFFMNDIRSPLIIGICMFVSLIISLLFFYVCGVSLNIISLTGLVLALGMMIDNSIIVTDNINQYRKFGYDIEDSCIKGTNEVIAPMLSSTFTTVSVFLPLIFMSGIAGAIFFDQAFSVTVGLLVAYLTGIMLLPTIYKVVFSREYPAIFSKKIKLSKKNIDNKSKESLPEKIYHRVSNWVFSHKIVTLVATIAIFPLCAVLFFIIHKEKMPKITQNELIINLEWNENIHITENSRRCDAFLSSLKGQVFENSALIGRQQFLLNRKRDQTSSEVEFYFKTKTPEEIPVIKTRIEEYLRQNHTKSIVTYSPAGTIFERIFMTAEPDLRIEVYPKNEAYGMSLDSVQSLKASINHLTGHNPSSISFQKQLRLQIDRERLMLHNIPLDYFYQALQHALQQEEVTTLRSFQQYLPIMIGNSRVHLNEIIQNLMISPPSNDPDKKPIRIPITEFIKIQPATGAKAIIAGSNGTYVPFELFALENPEKTVDLIKKNLLPNDKMDIRLSGAFFSNEKMLDELLVILVVSIMLMYFILAAQFESFLQPLIVLLEIPIAIAAALALLVMFGHSLNLMSAIGIIVTCGIIINDSILKLDIINQLRKKGIEITDAIHEAGKRRLNAILMTSLTSIVCMLPLLFSNDMGSELEKPLAISTIAGMVIGTPISLFVVPLVYWYIYRNKKIDTK